MARLIRVDLINPLPDTGLVPLFHNGEATTDGDIVEKTSECIGWIIKARKSERESSYEISFTVDN